jgi:hypothetical protein
LLELLVYIRLPRNPCMQKQICKKIFGG